jgi:hypothetical protein
MESSPFPRAFRARPGRLDRTRLRSVGSLGAALALLTVLVLLASGVAGAVGPTGAHPSAGARSLTASVCNAPNTSPSALDIPLADVGRDLPKGSSLLVSYEVGVTHTDRSVGGRRVYLPSLNGVFPIAGGGTLSVFAAPRNLTLTSNAWSLPVNFSKTLSGSENLTSSVQATLSSSKIAVMSNSTYGDLTLEFRWSYVVTTFGANATRATSPWTLPNSTAASGYLPSIFYPANLVLLASVGPLPAVAGSVLTLRLTGAVVNTTFRIVVEVPSGTETFSEWEATPVQHGPFLATANLSYVNSTPLPNGSYLIHVHDHCEAIVIILTLSIGPTGAILRLEPHGPLDAAR